jgi:hypothetical protein
MWKISGLGCWFWSISVDILKEVVCTRNEKSALSPLGNGQSAFLDNIDKSTWCVLAYKATNSLTQVSNFPPEADQEKETTMLKPEL